MFQAVKFFVAVLVGMAKLRQEDTLITIPLGKRSILIRSERMPESGNYQRYQCAKCEAKQIEDKGA